MTLRLPQRRRRSGGTQMRRRGIRGTVISRVTIYTIADRGVRGGLTKRLGGVVRNAKRHRVLLDGPTLVFPQLTRPRGGESGHRTQIRHRATLTRTLPALVLIGSDGARLARRRRAARALRPGPAIRARARAGRRVVIRLSRGPIERLSRVRGVVRAHLARRETVGRPTSVVERS